ncbi:MAG: hypothetical protein PVF66_09060 [Candidatus Aminicenantes bacterium]|jgi:hypothetical protein
MSAIKILNALKRHKFKLLLLILYVPISCSLIGLLAYYMRSPSPVEGRYPFLDVFWYYANPLNGDFFVVHFPTLVLSLAFLLLMVISTDSPKSIITIYPIRIVLLVLIVLITILVVIFNIITPLLFQPEHYMLLFLYVDVHLILVFLLTFLPLFRKLKTKLV